MKNQSKTEKLNKCLAVTAPCGTVDKTRLRLGVEQLQCRGYTVTIGESCKSERTFCEKDDRARCDELCTFLSDSRYSAVLCARGGYGAVRLFPHLPHTAFRGSPRLFGYSDATALHAVLSSRGVHCFHAPMVATEFGAEIDECTADSFFRMLNGLSRSYTYKCRMLMGNPCRGITAGGNLTVLASLCGSGFLPDYEDALLLLEDVNEPLYKIDRALMQLALSGVFQQVRAVLLGSFSGIQENLDAYFRSFFEDTGLSVAAGLQIGHEAPNLTFPLGCDGTLTGCGLTVHM